MDIRHDTLPMVDIGTIATTDVFIAAWRYMTGQYPGHVAARIGTLDVMLSQTVCTFFNMLAINAPIADAAGLRQAIDTARGYADRCPYDTMFLIPPEFLPDGAEAVLDDTGVSFSMSLSGMATDRLAPPRREAPALEFRFARDEGTALDLGRVNADAYGMARETFAITGHIPHWSGTHFGVVGYAGGRAVTAAQAYLLGDCIYVAMVATLPDCHGKGYGEGAMRHAITAAQEASDAGRLWLHATDMGRPLYRSMGFADGARVDLYSFGSHA